MARGDLTRRGAEGPEVLGRIARGLNAMIDGFSGILADARETTVSVSATASQLLASSMQIAHGAEGGSQQVHQVSSAVEQMAASMAQVSRHAEATAGSARKVLEQVRLGDASARAAFEGMARIDGSVESAAGRVRALEERSRHVFDVIDLIEEIAAQSNLLSLNAAIEAAHAGDAGRGFGVVADEIRRLADSSKESTAEAAGILEGLVEEMRSVLVAMAEVQEGVAAGRTHSAAARGSLDEIAALVQDSVRRTEEISVAAREQAQATRVVAGAVQSIALISQQSSQSARESAQAIGGLVAFAEQLAGTIARFRTGGTARAPGEPGRQATTLAPETSRSPAAAPSLR
jgi:twitching motility protein PilJ